MADSRDPVRAEFHFLIDITIDAIGAEVVKGRCATLESYKQACGKIAGLDQAKELYDAAYNAAYGEPEDDDDAADDLDTDLEDDEP